MKFINLLCSTSRKCSKTTNIAEICKCYNFDWFWTFSWNWTQLMTFWPFTAHLSFKVLLTDTQITTFWRVDGPVRSLVLVKELIHFKTSEIFYLYLNTNNFKGLELVDKCWMFWPYLMNMAMLSIFWFCMDKYSNLRYIRWTIYTKKPSCMSVCV